MGKYEGILSFIKELDKLKSNPRTAWTTTGREESVAEHSFRLAVFALVLKDEFPNLDFFKVLSMALIHDFGEVYEGDVSAKYEVDKGEKYRKELSGVTKLLESLPVGIREEILSIWQEYYEGKTDEAKFVKALDKIETIIQHNQGKNPPDFDYGFNLTYGKEYATFDPKMEFLRNLVDNETRQKMET